MMLYMKSSQFEKGSKDNLKSNLKVRKKIIKLKKHINERSFNYKNPTKTIFIPSILILQNSQASYFLCSPKHMYKCSRRIGPDKVSTFILDII